METNLERLYLIKLVYIIGTLTLKYGELLVNKKYYDAWVNNGGMKFKISNWISNDTSYEFSISLYIPDNNTWNDIIFTNYGKASDGIVFRKNGTRIWGICKTE